jgi:ABC-type methionine transport system permease subunit
MIHLPQAAMYAYIVPAFCCVACLAAPIAMRRIGRTTLSPLTAESTRNGRLFASLAVTVSALLGYCLPYVDRSFVLEPLFRNLTAVATLEAIVSMLVALPYVVLFIALTLIVDGDAGGVGAGAAGGAGGSDERVAI